MSSTRLMGYITVPDDQCARDIATELLNARLIACANILAPHRSIYAWQGSICDETEQAMLIKTTSDATERILKLVARQHPYDCPCVLFWPVERGNPEFLDWIGSCIDENAG